MTSSPIAALERWLAAGGTWRVRPLTDEAAVIDLCTCSGEVVDQLRSPDPVLLRYVEQRADASER